MFFFLQKKGVVNSHCLIIELDFFLNEKCFWPFSTSFKIFIWTKTNYNNNYDDPDPVLILNGLFLLSDNFLPVFHYRGIYIGRPGF